MATMTFEQPLNELTRLILRLEYLFSKIDANKVVGTPWTTKATLEALVHIIHLIDRPDLKSKFAKELQRQVNHLDKLSNQQNIDRKQLDKTIADLQGLFQYFNQSGTKVGQSLRSIEFLNNIRQHLMYPGGEAQFEMPAYQYWLGGNKNKQDKQIKDWLTELDMLRRTIDLLLKLLRNTGKTSIVTANNGFHQELLESNSHIKLVRMEVDPSLQVYPIVSAGKHRLVIRFYEGTHIQSEEQVHSDIQFKLTCCC